MPKAKRKAIQRAQSAYAKSAPTTRDVSNDVIRVATHFAMAPVARDMGFTVTGLLALCNDVTDKWTAIGTSRTSGATVYAIRPEFTSGRDEFGRMEIHGLLQFSIGNRGVRFTDAAMAIRTERQAIADRIVANLQSTRDFNVDKLANAIAQRHMVTETAISQDQVTGSSVTVVPHLGPRGPEPERILF